ncbi:MAG: ABC transporter substrate-binding protein [Gammaproteobacteria bacterium]|nr:MAG: ABC transporter substrate-binding protein [Gammaproteobacteria bacterium]
MKKLSRLGVSFWALLTSVLVTRPALALETVHLVSFDEAPLVTFGPGQPGGVLVHAVKTMFEKAGIHYDLKLLPPKRALLTAATEPNTCVFPIERSQEREARYRWISPISISRIGAYAPPGQQRQLVTLEDMRPFRLGTYLGSGIGEYLETFGMKVEYAARNELNLGKLVHGRIDFWVSDTVSADWLAKREGVRLGAPALVFFTSVRAMGCHPEFPESVRQPLQRTLTQMYTTGEMQRLYQAWFESQGKEQTP